METSVILSSYNQPKSLALGLYALTLQDNLDFELVIADDGSEASLGAMVRDFAAGAPFPVTFVTQDDDGFRKPTILNKAVLAAKGAKLVIMDGDCLAFPNHVSLHAAHLRPGHFCVGGRVSLPPGKALPSPPKPSETAVCGLFLHPKIRGICAKNTALHAYRVCLTCAAVRALSAAISRSCAMT